MVNYKIAVINSENPDSLARTIIDGLLSLSKKGEVDFRLSSQFDYILPVEDKVLKTNDFIKYASEADYIFFFFFKYKFNKELAYKIDKWHKTIFIDGSEVGRDRRYDFDIQNIVLNSKDKINGSVDKELLNLCCNYFKREKPYIDTVKPLPFGIETNYINYNKGKTKKDIDFFCVFGQEDYPRMRKYVRELVEKFCVKNNFSFHTKKTKTKKEFYELLARSKVGISIGGGGYDTMRFWEILANNCILLTEKIDIYKPDSNRLKYSRILECNNLYDFYYYLNKLGALIKDNYNEDETFIEYEKILSEHSTEERVREILKLSSVKKP